MEYLSEPQNFNENIKNKLIDVGYWSFDKIITMKHKSDTLYEYINNLYSNIDTKLNGVRDESFRYKTNGKLCKYKTENYIKQFNKVTIQNKEFYIDSELERNCSPLKEKTFFNIDLIVPNKNIKIEDLVNDYQKTTNEHEFVSYNIYDKLKKFFVYGNRLDQYFFKAFMKFFYNIDIETYFLVVLNNKYEKEIIKQEETIIF
jgi:hypothetical protein